MMNSGEDSDRYWDKLETSPVTGQTRSRTTRVRIQVVSQVKHSPSSLRLFEGVQLERFWITERHKQDLGLKLATPQRTDGVSRCPDRLDTNAKLTSHSVVLAQAFFPGSVQPPSLLLPPGSALICGTNGSHELLQRR